jgi:hypothetical protein
MGINSTKSLQRFEAITPPSSGAPLLLYVAASHAVVGAALSKGRRRYKSQFTSSPKYWVLKKLHIVGEGTIYRVGGLQKASSLFSVLPYKSTFVTTLKRYHRK